MNKHKASRRLVKSPPELWAEVSGAEALGRHLGHSFGEVRITKLKPESTVAWEGDRARGTVELESSGWGTRVTFTVAVEEPVPEAEPVSEAEPEAEPVPVAVPEPEPVPVQAQPPVRRGLLARFRRMFAPPQQPAPAVQQPPAAPEPAPAPPPAPGPEPRADLEPALNAALDSLGQAHHRPFSRA